MLMVTRYKISRHMESDLSVIRVQGWNGEPVPYHNTIARHLRTIPYCWLAGMLVRLCMAE